MGTVPLLGIFAAGTAAPQDVFGRRRGRGSRPVAAVS
jgi:hypothetical protein